MMQRSVKNSIISLRKIFEDTLGGLIADLDENESAYELKYQWARNKAAELAIERMPILDSRQGASEYIACVAWLAQQKLIDGQQTRALLYAAQTAISSFGVYPSGSTNQKTKGKENASKSRKS